MNDETIAWITLFMAFSRPLFWHQRDTKSKLTNEWFNYNKMKPQRLLFVLFNIGGLV